MISMKRCIKTFISPERNFFHDSDGTFASGSHSYVSKIPRNCMMLHVVHKGTAVKTISQNQLGCNWWLDNTNNLVAVVLKFTDKEC